MNISLQNRVHIQRPAELCVSITVSVGATVVHVRRDVSVMLALYCLGQSFMTNLQNQNSLEHSPQPLFNLSGGLTQKKPKGF